MKITGLIRAFRAIQQHLKAGIHPDEAARFRQSVSTLIRDVENLCARHRASPDQLPGPSRRAYAGLKAIDLARLPLQDSVAPPIQRERLQIKNVVGNGRYFAELFWSRSGRAGIDATAADETRRELVRHTETIEQVCARQESDPSALQDRSRDVYRWMKFLTLEDRLDQHMAALRRAREALATRLPSGRRPLSVHLVHTSGTLWRVRGATGRPLITVSQGFMHGDVDLWHALLGAALLGKHRTFSRWVQGYADSKEYRNVQMELQAMAPDPPEAARGRIHDLLSSFERVNARYFAGGMKRPSLSWSGVPAACKFGHYDAARDHVVLSMMLDDARVPEWVLDFVMYHELLHKKHGVARVNGRRRVHHPAFQAEERRFHRCEEAERFLKALALKQRLS